MQATEKGACMEVYLDDNDSHSATNIGASGDYVFSPSFVAPAGDYRIIITYTNVTITDTILFGPALKDGIALALFPIGDATGTTLTVEEIQFEITEPASGGEVFGVGLGWSGNPSGSFSVGNVNIKILPEVATLRQAHTLTAFAPHVLKFDASCTGRVRAVIREVLNPAAEITSRIVEGGTMNEIYFFVPSSNTLDVFFEFLDEDSCVDNVSLLELTRIEALMKDEDGVIIYDTLAPGTPDEGLIKLEYFNQYVNVKMKFQGDEDIEDLPEGCYTICLKSFQSPTFAIESNKFCLCYTIPKNTLSLRWLNDRDVCVGRQAIVDDPFEHAPMVRLCGELSSGPTFSTDGSLYADCKEFITQNRAVQRRSDILTIIGAPEFIMDALAFALYSREFYIDDVRYQKVAFDELSQVSGSNGKVNLRVAIHEYGSQMLYERS